MVCLSPGATGLQASEAEARGWGQVVQSSVRAQSESGTTGL